MKKTVSTMKDSYKIMCCNSTEENKSMYKSMKNIAKI